MAGFAGTLWCLEQRVETLRPIEQGWRFRSLLRRARLDEFVRASDPDVRLDHRARACVGRRSKGGQEGQALGRSRGGFTTKIHAKSDASGDIIAFDLTGGQASDARHFDILLDIDPDIQPRAVICDKGYASKANREAARKRGIAPVIPHKANERDKPTFFPRTLYKARSRIEQGVGRLKRFKRVALRCEKTERNLRSIVSFAAGLCLIKFVHTA
jgi:transposase